MNPNHAADADVLDRVSSVIPEELEFIAEIGRRLDLVGAILLDENLGIRPGDSEVRRAFDARLWEMALFASSPSSL